MKIMKDYLMEVEKVDGGVKAILVGGGYMAQKLSLVLHNRGLSCALISRAKDLDLSSAPEFIFLFSSNDENIPETVLNFAEAIKSKVILISLDKPCGENIIKQCLEKDTDFCSVEIHDVFSGDGASSALENIFLGVKKKKLVSFKNDQIVVTPIFVDDVVEALCRIAFSTQTYKKNFLLTGKEEIPLVGFGQRIAAEVGRMYGLLLRAEENGHEYPQSVARHDKILNRDESYRLLNWRPEIGLIDGIKLSIGNQPAEESVQPIPESKKKMTLGL